MKEIKAPSELPDQLEGLGIFLAGSIEGGSAPGWQSRMLAALADLDVTVFNPRRDDWDESWRETIDDPQFSRQVEWELKALERADLVAMYLAADTQSPVSLLELGLHARSGKLIVCCSEGFWKKGNVDVVCRHFGVERATHLDELIERVRAVVRSRG